MVPGYHLEVQLLNAPGYHGCHPPAAIPMASEQVRNAIARCLAYAGISMDPGRIERNSGLEPEVLATGNVSFMFGSQGRNNI